MQIKDNSNDKKYFTIIPNYIANHSTANDQALYFQMKRLVGDEEGICSASEKYFKDKLGIGSKALKKSLKYLLDHEWIEYAGVREIKTKGGPQKIKTYIVKDIWKKNIEYFEKGVSERRPLSKSKGVSERKQRGVQKESKGVAFKQQRRTIKKNIEEEVVSKADAPFSFKDKLKEMLSSKRRDLQIIALYWQRKGYGFNNNDQYQSALKRELRAAKNLKGYSDDRILEVIEFLEEIPDLPKWTLETVHKYVDDDLSEINIQGRNYQPTT